MTEYVRKNLRVEAVQYNGENGEEVTKFAGEANVQDQGGTLLIFGRPGQSPHTASPSDWIVRDVEDYFYACRDSLFKKLYDPA